MAILSFPDPRLTTPDGILAIGGDLEVGSLMLAYRQGIFPWPMPGFPLVWFCPPERAILKIDDLHIPKSLVRAKKRSNFHFTIDREFRQVIQKCASAPRPGQDGTWITPQLMEAYIRLHDAGIAHSVEVWDSDCLVGGIYGVDAGGAFAGESMFYEKPNASKFAILFLIEYLKNQGAEWIDIQVLTPHMESLGAKTIPREEFLTLLRLAQAKGLQLFPDRIRTKKA